MGLWFKRLFATKHKLICHADNIHTVLKHFYTVISPYHELIDIKFNMDYVTEEYIIIVYTRRKHEKDIRSVKREDNEEYTKS